MSKKMLIIGGAGFIGINAARYFLDKGYAVTILDNFQRKGTEQNVATLMLERPESVAVVRADIRTDQDTLNQLMEEHDAVLHMAAQVAVTTSIVNPREDFEQNVLGTFNVLEAIRLSKNQPPLLFASTNKVYGGLEYHPVDEDTARYKFADAGLCANGVCENTQLDFHSPYGCSKGAAEQYVIDYARIYGLKTVVFRQSCIYGEHQFGVEDQGWVAWLSIAIMLDKPFTVFGTGKQVRDLLFVEDLCRLYDLALENIDTVSGRAYNVGGGPSNTLSLLELLEYLKTTHGYVFTPQYGEVRAGDQPVFVADIRKAKADLGWEPAIGVDEGLGRLTGWLKDNQSTIKQILG